MLVPVGVTQKIVSSRYNNARSMPRNELRVPAKHSCLYPLGCDSLAITYTKRLEKTMGGYPKDNLQMITKWDITGFTIQLH